MKHYKIPAFLASVSAVALLSATPAAAQTFSGRESTRVLLPFSLLNSTPEGRAALAANLAAVVAIANTSSAARRAEAIVDNTLVMGGGSIAPGLGTKLNTVYQANASSTNAVLGNSGTAAIIRQWPSLALSDAVTAKNFFAFGGADTKQAAPVPVFTGLTLPTGGIFDVYDVAYGVNPLYSRNPNGNTRPYALPNSQIQNFTTIQGGSNDSSAAFPSGHATLGAAEGILLAQMIPERYGELLYRASEEGHSRLVLGVHYPTDIIGGRILSTYELVQIISNNPNYTGISAGGVALPADRLPVLASATTAVRNMLEAGCGGTIQACIGAFDPASEPAFRTMRNDYLFRMTYGLPAVGPTNVAPIVPVGAEVLLTSRFPYLSVAQRRDVLASTEIASGSALDNGEGWARLNLFDASNGFGSLTAATTVTMDGSLGGFSAFDVWRNSISGTGSLTKAGTGTLVLTGANNTWTGATTISGGVLNVTSFGSLPAASAVTNNATLSMMDGNTDGRLKVASYSGTGVLALDVNLVAGSAASDSLTVTGAASGGTIVLNQVTAAQYGSSLGKGLILIETANPTGFTLAGGAIHKGLFDYSLASTSAGLALVSVPSAAGRQLVSIPGAIEEIWAAAHEGWQDQQTALRDGMGAERSAWISGYGRSIDQDVAGGKDELRPSGLSGGVDTLVSDLSPFGGMLRVGASGGYSEAKQEFANAGGSRIKYTGPTLGFGASLTMPSGLFANVGVSETFLDIEIRSNEPLALGATQLDRDTKVVGVSGSAGYKWAFGETGFVEPTVQVSIANGSEGLRTMLAGNDVNWNTDDGLRTRIGVRAGATLSDSGSGKMVVSGEVASVNSSDDPTASFTAPGVATLFVRSPAPDQITEVRAGLQYDADSWSGLVKAGYRKGSGYEAIDLSAAVRVAF